MGNTPSTVGVGDFEFLSQNFEFIRKFNDTRFGDVKLLRERASGAKILQKDYVTNSAKVFEATLNEVKKRASVNHPNIIRVIGYTSKHETAFCAEYYKVSVFYESYEYDLESDIIARRQKDEYFPEAEIWDILDCIVTACAHLESTEEAHGDIRPYNIFACGDSEYKIVDPRLFSGGHLPFEYTLESRLENKARHYSPLVFSYLGQTSKKAPIQHDKYKSDVFSLGLTILEAVTLKNLEFVYNWKEHTIEMDKIKEILKEQAEQKIYSTALIETISLMLSVDEAQRPNFLKLDADLSLYRADIRTRTIKTEFAHTPIQTEQNEAVEETKAGEAEENDLDARIRAAIEKSEATMKNFPIKHIIENVNVYYDHLVKQKGDSNEINLMEKGDAEATRQGGHDFPPVVRLETSNQSNSKMAEDNRLPKQEYRAVANADMSEYKPYARNKAENIIASNSGGAEAKPYLQPERNEYKGYTAQGNTSFNNNAEVASSQYKFQASGTVRYGMLGVADSLESNATQTTTQNQTYSAKKSSDDLPSYGRGGSNYQSSYQPKYRNIAAERQLNPVGGAPYFQGNLGYGREVSK